MIEPEPVTRLQDLVAKLTDCQEALLERWLAATSLAQDDHIWQLSQALLEALLGQLSDGEANSADCVPMDELMALRDKADGNLSGLFSHLAVLQQVLLGWASKNVSGQLTPFVSLCEQMQGVIERWRQMLVANIHDPLPRSGDVPGFMQQLIITIQAMYEHVCTAIQQVIDDTEAAVTQLFSQQQAISNASNKLNADLQQFNERSENLQSDFQVNLQVITEASQAATYLPEQLRQERSQVEQLLNSVLNLADFAKVIRRISSETRSLSINAKIEAVRAGEFGKGFSVVADEVRMLSKNSLEASEQIQEKLKMLQEIMTSNFAQGFEESLHEKENVLNNMSQATHQLSHVWEHMRKFYHDELRSEAMMNNIALADDMIATLGSIQFQDIVRQKIERLTTLLNQQSDALNQLQSSLADDTGLDELAWRAIFTTMQSNLEQYALEEQDHNSFDLGDGAGSNKIELF